MTYYERNKERILESAKEFYLINRERLLSNSKEYYSLNREKRKEYQRNYARENNVTGCSGLKKLRERSHEKYLATCRRIKLKKRARLNSASDGSVTTKGLLALYRDNPTCEYCGITLTAQIRQIDHKVPLCLGGDHSIANLAIACASCNLRKGSMPFDKWMSLLVERWKGL